MRRGPGARWRRGATLVEVLVAVALLAALAAALAPAIYTAIRVASRVNSAAAAAENVRTLRDVLTDLLDHIVQFEAGEPPFALDGAQRTATLTVLRSGAAEPETVTLAIVDGDLRLQSDLDLTLPRRATPDQASAMLPLGDVTGFAYYGKRGDGRTATWSNDWAEAEAPLLFRIETKRGPRDFYVGPRSPIICAFDPVSQRCR